MILSSSLIVIIFLTFINTAYGSFEFNCSAMSPEKLRILEEEARLMLDQTPQIYACGRDNLKNGFTLSYTSCIDDLKIPSDYEWPIKLLTRDDFLTEARFKSKIEKIGNEKCNESSIYQDYKSTVKGGSIESQDNIIYIVIGLVVVIAIVVVAVMIYRNNKAKEVEQPGYGVTVTPNTPVPVTYPAQYPQVVTPVASNFVAGNTFQRADPITSSYVAPNTFDTALPPSYTQSVHSPAQFYTSYKN